jgi:hypothetical protein
LRSDRSLALRVSPTTGVTGELRARNAADVLDVITRGRVRYVVVFHPDPDQAPDLPPEWTLLDRVAADRPELFRLVARFWVRINDYRRGVVYVWEYQGVLPPGPSEIPVEVPTAGLKL